MSSTTGCRNCRGLCAGAASRCHDCGRWVRSQDYDASGAHRRTIADSRAG